MLSTITTGTRRRGVRTNARMAAVACCVVALITGCEGFIEPAGSLPEHSPSPDYDPDIQAELAVWGYWVMYSEITNGDAEPEDRYIEQFATQAVAAEAYEQVAALDPSIVVIGSYEPVNTEALPHDTDAEIVVEFDLDSSELLFIEQDGTRYGTETLCEAYVATLKQQPDGNYLVAELELIGASNGCPE